MADLEPRLLIAAPLPDHSAVANLQPVLMHRPIKTLYLENVQIPICAGFTQGPLRVFRGTGASPWVFRSLSMGVQGDVIDLHSLLAA